MREHARPRKGVNVAAIMFCLLHIKVSVAGKTAEEMMTPIKRYRSIESRLVKDRGRPIRLLTAHRDSNI